MSKQRIERLNSLLREVISDVIRRDVRNPHVNELLTITRADISRDLHYAKVYVSIIGSPEQKAETLAALQSAAGFIAIQASRQVVMRYFPSLTFKLDDSVDKHLRIEELLHQLSTEKNARKPEETDDVAEMDEFIETDDPAEIDDATDESKP